MRRKGGEAEWRGKERDKAAHIYRRTNSNNKHNKQANGTYDVGWR